MASNNINDYLLSGESATDAARAAAQTVAFGAAGADNEAIVVGARPVQRAIEEGDIRMAILQAASIGATMHLQTIIGRVAQVSEAVSGGKPDQL